MPTYLEILPEDVLVIIYKCLNSSVLRDMKDKDIYKNTKYFHRLLKITSDPLICDLDYLGMLNINNIYDIFKYMKNRIRYDELFQPETAIYQRSYFTKKLELDIDNIEIFNIFNLYKINKGYYIAFVNEYMLFNDCVDGSITIKIRKGNFILQKNEPIKCLAELLFIVIDFYNIIKNKLIQNIESLDVEGQILTQRQRKDKYILEDILNYHIINRFIIRFDYDIDNKSAYPILLCY
jgi:hypothetical protein